MVLWTDRPCNGEDRPQAPLESGDCAAIELISQDGESKEQGHDKDGEYLTDALTAAAIDWLTARERPFFLYLAYHAVHAPFDPKPDLLKEYGKGRKP